MLNLFIETEILLYNRNKIINKTGKTDRGNNNTPKKKKMEGGAGGTTGWGDAAPTSPPPYKKP